MKNRNMDLQFFATEENATTATDLELVIPIDFTTWLSENIDGLREVLGVIERMPIQAGVKIPSYKMTKNDRKLAREKNLTLKKYRKATTAAENLYGTYIPVGGDVAKTFNLTMDQTGLIGMTHYTTGERAAFETLMMSSGRFRPKYADGVFKATIAPAE